jgi:hypothetical protein
MTELHEGLCDRIVLAPKDMLDIVTSVDVQMHNVVAESSSMVWDFDLKDSWLTKARWSTMVRQYLDPVELANWLNKTAQLINWNGRGISLLRTKVIQPRGGPASGNKETRRWGSCMISISYKALPAPQITLHSRTSYMGYLAGMDMTVAWMCGRYLAALMGGEVEQMKFLWINEAMQYHNFKSLAYLLNHHDPYKNKLYRKLLMAPDEKLKPKHVEMIRVSPALTYSRQWMQKVVKEDAAGRTLGDLSYNTYRRIIRRYHTEIHGYDYAKQFEGWQYWKKGPNVGEERAFFKAYAPLPHVHIKELNFAPLGLPGLDNLDSVDYDEGQAAKYLEEEDD